VEGPARGVLPADETRLLFDDLLMNPDPPIHRIPSSPPRPDRFGLLFTANTHPPDVEEASHGNPTAETRNGIECSPILVGLAGSLVMSWTEISVNGFAGVPVNVATVFSDTDRCVTGAKLDSDHNDLPVRISIPEQVVLVPMTSRGDEKCENPKVLGA